MTSAREFRSRFIAFIDDYHHALGLEPSCSIPGEGEACVQAEWANVQLLVHHSMTRHPERLLVRCALGEVPRDNAEPALRRLLQLQRELTPAAPMMLSVDPIGQRVWCSKSVALSDVSAPVMLAEFVDMVLRADEWLTTHYVDDDDTHSQPAHAGVPAGGLFA